MEGGGGRGKGDGVRGRKGTGGPYASLQHYVTRGKSLDLSELRHPPRGHGTDSLALRVPGRRVRLRLLRKCSFLSYSQETRGAQPAAVAFPGATRPSLGRWVLPLPRNTYLPPMLDMAGNVGITLSHNPSPTLIPRTEVLRRGPRQARTGRGVGHCPPWHSGRSLRPGWASRLAQPSLPRKTQAWGRPGRPLTGRLR